MSFDNLLSGLIGGVVGGLLGLIGAVIVTHADDRRWERANVAAARLVFYEVLNNRIMLMEPLLGSMATKDAWEAEQVRIASLLDGKDLEIVAKAYRMLTIILETRAIVGDAAWRDSFNNEEGQRSLARLRAAFDQAEPVLVRAGKLTPPSPSAPSGWLGTSAGGLVRLA